jgi:hypothetical protein
MFIRRIFSKSSKARRCLYQCYPACFSFVGFVSLAVKMVRSGLDICQSVKIQDLALHEKLES